MVADAKPVNLGVETPAPAKKSDKPVIEYYGEGADKVKFEVDQNAKRIRVYGNGTILVDY